MCGTGVGLLNSYVLNKGGINLKCVFAKKAVPYFILVKIRKILKIHLKISSFVLKSAAFCIGMFA